MPTPTHSTTTSIARSDMTADQLALPGSERVRAETRYGAVVGGRVRNGCQVFLNVPYALPVPRFTDALPLPRTYRYEGEFTRDALYAAQPSRVYTDQIPVRDRLGQGQPTETPFFADIYVPSDYDLGSASAPPSAPASPSDVPSAAATDPTPTSTSATSAAAHTTRPQRLRPVRVFIHGGFLQFGSTSGDNYNQQFFAAEHFGEIRVLLGHRVSVFGFLASETPFVSGNYGFKDCWLGLQWIQENIAAFGGDPDQVHLSGLSGGGHVVHQLLHYAARCSPARSPFVTALLQSNAILAPSLPRSARADQFAALCRALDIDPAAADALDQLRDEEAYPTWRILDAVGSMGALCTFRGVADVHWVAPDQLEYQRTGMGAALAAAGVKCVIAGDVRDEDHFYAMCHEAHTPDALLPNVARYYPTALAAALLESYPPLAADADAAACQQRLGRVLADGQVHLPVRLLAADLAPHVPTVRYTIELVAAALGYKGKASHGSDLAIQHVRFSVLSDDERSAALDWHKALNAHVECAIKTPERFTQRPEGEVLALLKSGRTAWVQDWRWPLLRDAQRAVRPE